MKASEAAERAAHYVEAHGDDFARLQARALLGEAPAAAALDALAPDASRAGPLRDALGVCDDLRARSGARVRAWVSMSRAGASASVTNEPTAKKARAARPKAEAIRAGSSTDHWAKGGRARSHAPSP